MHPCPRLIVVATFWIALAHQSSAAISVPFAPSKDNTLIQQTNPASQTSNGLGDIFVGRTNQGDAQSRRRGLVEFDLSAFSLPPNATITEVTLTMREPQSQNGSQSVSLHRVLNEWGEGSSSGGGMGAAAGDDDATWLYTFYNSANPGSSTAWATEGGDFEATPSATLLVPDGMNAAQVATWSSLSNPQMIADVQLWLSSPADNHGWLLKGNEDVAQTVKRFNSREMATAPNMAPVLTITYVPEPATAALTALAGAALAIRCGRRAGLGAERDARRGRA